MPDRLLIIDASLSPRISSELRKRGRPSRSVADVSDKTLKDPPLLRDLTAKLDDSWTLVTADDAMPDEHGELMADLGLTVATLEPWDRVDTTLKQEDYKHEIVHRWAHVMADQDSGSVRRYFLTTNREWIPRR